MRHCLILARSRKLRARARTRLDQVSIGMARASVLQMSKLLRGVAAGWGAKKLGGGCFTTILVFALLWYLLGHFQIFR
jgi:hypothetical protein